MLVQRGKYSKQLLIDRYNKDKQKGLIEPHVIKSEKKLVSYLPNGKKKEIVPFFHPSKNGQYVELVSKNAIFYANLHTDDYVRDTFQTHKHIFENMDHILADAKKKALMMSQIKYSQEEINEQINKDEMKRKKKRI